MRNIITDLKTYIKERFDERVVSAKDIIHKSENEELLKLTYPYNRFIGYPAKNFDMAISGAAESGKTTFLLEFANYYAKNFGKTLYISSEEFDSITLVQKLKKIIGEDGEISDNLFFARGMSDLEGYALIIIDSITDLHLDLVDYKELRHIYKHTAFINVLQYTKAGDFRGTNEWMHEVEVFLEIEDGVISIRKNRYGISKVKWDVFRKKLIVPKTKKIS